MWRGWAHYTALWLGLLGPSWVSSSGSLPSLPGGISPLAVAFGLAGWSEDVFDNGHLKVHYTSSNTFLFQCVFICRMFIGSAGLSPIFLGLVCFKKHSKYLRKAEGRYCCVTRLWCNRIPIRSLIQPWTAVYFWRPRYWCSAQIIC